MPKILLTFILTLLLGWGILVSPRAETIDDDPEASSLYAKGKRLLREGDFFNASKTFSELEGRFSDSKNLDLFVLHRSKAKYYYGDYSEAAAGFSYFVSYFGSSKYLPEGYFFLGNAYYMQGDLNRAVKAYLKSYELADNNAIENLSKSSLVAAFKNASEIYVTPADFETLSADKKCKLLKPLAEIFIERKEITTANQLLADCGESVDINATSEGNTQRGDALLEIALVLPLSGEMMSYGEEVYNGAVIAAELYRKESGKKLKIVPYDTKGDPVEAAQIVSQLSNSVSTDVVIGPLTSEEALVASAALTCSNLPLIAPAATQAGLTRLSKTSFQMAPNIELEGVTLAGYAFNTLKADTVAIISSSTYENIRMTQAFERQFTQLGGTVIAVEYYRSRDNDFGEYIKDIKGIILGHPADSTDYINEDGDTLDFELLPVYLDCLFLPGDPKQLRQLIPQINFYNLNSFYLGSDGWGDNAVYKLGEPVTKGAVFASPFLEGRISENFMTLAAEYDIRFGKRPQRLAALGYDAVQLVIKSARDGITRDNLVQNLRKIQQYNGASGNITFGEHRENIEMPLYKIENERHQSIFELPVDTLK